MSHKALVFAGPAIPFELVDRPTPKPGPDQVLVKNVTVGLNKLDYMIQHLGLWVDYYGYPAMTGIDGAGEVVAVGESVQGLTIGDRALYQALYHPDTMSFQEYTIADAVQVAKIPSSISWEGAATFGLPFATAALGLYQKLLPRGGIGLTAPWEEGGYKKYAGQPAIVTGGASSVGQFAIQLLKASGFGPIITTASKHNEEYCKSAGATHVIDYHEVPYSELPAAVKKITPLPIPVVYDAVSTPDAQKAVWEILAPKGKLVTVLRPAYGKAGEASEDGKEVTWAFGIPAVATNYEVGKKMYVGITKLLESGDLKPIRFEVIPRGLAGIPDGLTRLAKGVSGVKFVARVAETSGEVGGQDLKDAIPPYVGRIRHIYPVGQLPDM